MWSLLDFIQTHAFVVLLGWAVINGLFMTMNWIHGRMLYQWHVRLQRQQRAQQHFANTMVGKFVKPDGSLIDDSEQSLLIQAIFDKPPYTPQGEVHHDGKDTISGSGGE